MKQQASTLLYLPGRGGADWVERYLAERLSGKDERTQDAYQGVTPPLVLAHLD